MAWHFFPVLQFAYAGRSGVVLQGFECWSSPATRISEDFYRTETRLCLGLRTSVEPEKTASWWCLWSWCWLRQLSNVIPCLQHVLSKFESSFICTTAVNAETQQPLQLFQMERSFQFVFFFFFVIFSSFILLVIGKQWKWRLNATKWCWVLA